MARQLTFKIKRKEYSVVPVKVDRKKLYGWTEVIALDDNGNPCQLLSTDDTGAFVIPKGGTGLGIMSQDGKWIDRSLLKTVKSDGSPVELITSSYSTLIKLTEKISPEELLDYNITDFYQLNDVPDEILNIIGEDIYTFPYNYLDSYETSPAFLLTAEVFGQGKILFMMIGVRNVFEMLCFGDCGDIDADEEDLIELTEDDDNLDFSMFQV